MRNLWSTLLIVLLGAAPGWAVLGEYASSIDLDQQVLRGERRELTGPGYRVHELTSPDGLVLREFVSPAGLVFGVTWQAPKMPNLQQVLGDHNMSELQQVLASRPRCHTGAPLMVRTANLVFVSGGHMRSFHGYAYVPSLVPANVSAGVMHAAQN
jgi:hypothetical protein